MGKATSIEWTKATWNPWQGCRKVSLGCKNCYMYRAKKRYGQNPDVIVRSSKTTFNSPLKWKDSSLIFTCSWSDWFIEEADQWRDEGWEIIRRSPHHIFQILTKRPGRIAGNLPPDWHGGWKNVWLGVSIENQECLHRLNLLSNIPASVKFISAEPLLEPIDFNNLMGIDWVITGGESGPGYRPLNLAWVRSIRDLCQRFNVPFYHKQNGGARKVNGSWGGNVLDGRTWEQMPAIFGQ